ncbi:CHAT domain protein [Rhizoctonia solani]|uniref:CHAT domain protein n=1 Tax=Rhizoctonia solani TaxID=456999 RepID=A0A8H8NTT5_9AGAM|nr:CHAT domain protein [Rhizoctonia solani]QRW18678.1 CHAT domain protein [Rhizoctonia solani]
MDELDYETLWEQATSHCEQFQQLGTLTDLEKAIGACYGTRFQGLGDFDDLKKSIECSVRALDLTPDDDPGLPVQLGNLAVSYIGRYHQEDPPDRHAALGSLYTERYRQRKEFDDLEKSIKHCSRALALTPEGHPKLSDRHADLAAAYNEKFRRTRELEHLEKSIEHGSRALALTLDGHPKLSDWHGNLGVLYNDSYRYTGRLDELEKSIEHCDHALALTTDGDPNLSDWHSTLGKVDRTFFLRTRAHSQWHPHLHYRHFELGVSYVDRYRRVGEVLDLEKAVEHCSCALALTPEGHPDLPGRHSYLGTSYGIRYGRLGRLEDVEKAIEHFSSALALTPNGHAELPDRHAALGVSYGDRYRRTGELDELDKSIEHRSRALELTPDDHPGLPRRHADLGVSYTDRYRRMGEIDDLEKAIECDSCALALTFDIDPDLPRRHAALGRSYRHRYDRTRDLADLENIIKHDSRALALTPEDHPDLADRHNALGLAYSDLYRHVGGLEDLERSIQHFSRAFSLTLRDHPDLPHRHAALGMSYEDRYLRMGQKEDLEKSNEHLSLALALTTEGHPDLPLRHCQKAISCHLQYQRTHDSSYLDSSLASFRKASQLSSGGPRGVFDYALRWANLASMHEYLNPFEAFRVTIDLLPHFIWLGATTTQRYEDLLLAENIAVRAASAAIQSSEYDIALEWLEHARCVVWNQTLMLRSPLDDLAESHPALAAQLQSVSNQLNLANSRSPTSDSGFEPPEIRHRLAREYEGLLSQTRTLPGFENFLQPTKVNDLMRSARNGPVVVINCHETRCDALIIMPGEDHVRHIALASLTEQKMRDTCSEMEKLLQFQGLRQRGPRRPLQEQVQDVGPILAVLWYDIVKPVLDHLGYTNNDSTENLPHITWCPTGAVSFLPLHAAGDYEQPRSRVFDYAISSYTPTLAALLSSTPTAPNRTPRVLAIGQTGTPGCTPLPGTNTELSHVKARMEGKAEYSQLIDDQATTQVVLDAMEQHDWVHLACHAHQSAADPTSSGFFLHDGTLDLVAINRRSFKNKGLAFLSACQTATGDEQLPDEAIHLASGMLMAGYPSVIATMWSVMDEDAPFVADRVYAQLMESGMIGNGEAGRALHGAVAALRNEVGEKNFARWVPYIHIGS